MPGLPPIPFDTGVEIPECPIFGDAGPFRLMMKMEGVKNTSPSATDWNQTLIIEQLDFRPHLYEGFTEFQLTQWLDQIVLGDGPFDPPLILVLTSTFSFIFEATNTTPCSPEGTFQNKYTLSVPSNGGYYDGTMTVTIF